MATEGQKGFAPLIIVIILAIVGIVAAYYFGSMKGNVLLAPTQTPTSVTTNAPSQITPTTKPTSDSTANWKTYTNSVHGITFKYPQTWQVDNKGDQDSLNAQVTLTKGQAKIKMYFNMDGIGGQGQTYQGQPFRLNGNSLFRFVKTNSYDNTQMVGISTSLTNTLGVFEVNGKTYSITLAYPVSDSQTETGNSLEKEFDQILSTFKFTK